MGQFLKTEKVRIVSQAGQPVELKGVNLGGWLMMEAYFMHSPNFPEQHFKKGFEQKLGKEQLKLFERDFRENFIRESDVARIARLGFNCLRVPFNHRMIEEKPYTYEPGGASYLDKVIRWSRKNKIWVILDLHGACGCQNHDWHSDSYGKAELWEKKTFQDRTLALWEFLADRYKNEEFVAGYDLLNEAVVKDAKKLNDFYKKLVKRIRLVDQNHILFIEGNLWATDLDCLDEFDDDNYALSVHNYSPLNFTSNFVPHLSYPLKGKNGTWDKNITHRHLLKYKRISQKRQLPVFVGEFGVNARAGLFGEDQWLDDVLDCFKEFGFHWTYWTYKAVKNHAFPDGIYSYMKNPPWVNRAGPRSGWETFRDHWLDKRLEMVRSWDTKEFSENQEIMKVLRKYV